MTDKNKIATILVLFCLVIFAGVGWRYFISSESVGKVPLSSTEVISLAVPQATSVPPLRPAITSEIKTYRNEEWGFGFEYPKDFVIRENVLGYSPFSKFDLAGAPTKKEYLIYRPATPFLINIATPDFADRQFFDIRNTATEIMVGGFMGLKYKYEEQDTTYTTVILPLSQYKMILSTTNTYEDIFNQILASFKFFQPSVVTDNGKLKAAY